MKKPFGAQSDMVPLLVIAICAIAILFIPLKIISYGFLPSDDALYHAAKVISGKSWNEILVLRPGITMDRHPGWYAVLGAMQNATGASVDGLVVFAVVFLFAVFCLAPIFFLERPEAWLLTLSVLGLTVSGWITRLIAGRPYIFTMTVTLILCFLWPRLRRKTADWPLIAVLTLLIAVSTWIHCAWYLFALPVVCFLLAREYRAGIIIAGCVILGVLADALLTGRPFTFIYETIAHMSRATIGYNAPRMLVNELRPFDGSILVVYAAFMLLMRRSINKTWRPKIIDNPVFIIAALGWAMGFIVWRFWLDWGAPAFAVWMAMEFQEALKEKSDLFSTRRVWIAAAAAAVLFLCFTADYNNRWTRCLNVEYLSADNPEQLKWLPERGGIIYSDDETVFYQTFYKNPHAHWRYILGPEQSMMPREDLDIVKNICLKFRAYGAFEPWVKKMRSQDRLIIRDMDGPPAIPGLEWCRATREIWIGRLPRKK